jgi:hypothetical protein
MKVVFMATTLKLSSSVAMEEPFFTMAKEEKKQLGKSGETLNTC